MLYVSQNAEPQDGLSSCEAHHSHIADAMMGFAALDSSYDFTKLEKRSRRNASIALTVGSSAMSASIAPMAAANFAPWPEQGEAMMMRGSAGSRSMMNSPPSSAMTSALAVL